MITKEMGERFEKRTRRHIDLVQKYAKKIEKLFPELKGLVDQAKKHDASKYESPEYEPYVYITWRYKRKEEDGKDFEIPKEIDDHIATFHHVTHNSHHPEFHDPEVKEDSINPKDRHKPPEKIVNATNMPDLDIAEMVADWCAMSEEKSSDPLVWADQNVGKRWKFSKKQKDLIYKLINAAY